MARPDERSKFEFGTGGVLRRQTNICLDGRCFTLPDCQHWNNLDAHEKWVDPRRRLAIWPEVSGLPSSVVTTLTTSIFSSPSSCCLGSILTTLSWSGFTLKEAGVNFASSACLRSSGEIGTPKTWFLVITKNATAWIGRR